MTPGHIDTTSSSSRTAVTTVRTLRTDGEGGPPARSDSVARRRRLIDDARGRIGDELSRLVADGPVALLDCPAHPNVGDSAIWVGQREAIRAAGVSPPVYTCTVDTYDPEELERRLPRGTILLSGGGNFGDLYPTHQRFRAEVIRRFPRCRIVILPQSVRFRRPESLDRARRVCEAHPDLHLLVRTRRSLERAREAFEVPVHLCPDMAFALGPLPRAGSGERRLLLLRRDGESARPGAVRGEPRNGEDLADWGGGYREPTSLSAFGRWLAWRWNGDGARHLEALADYVENFWTRQAWCRVVAGLRILSGHETLVTDRLHGHILAFLAGVPHVALDNSYGKVHAYVRTWTSASPLVRTAESLEEARAAAEELPEGAAQAAPGIGGP